MSDENENEHGDEGGSGLRKQLEAALAKQKEAEARAAAAETALADTRLETFLSGKKVNPKFARLAKADKVDVTDDAALEKWLGENADLIGYKPGETPAEPPVNDGGQSNVPDEVKAAWHGIQTATAAGVSATRDKLESIEASLPKNATADQVLTALREGLG